MKPKKLNTIQLLTVCIGPAIAGMTLQSAQAASSTWNAIPTNGVWEATGGEFNWQAAGVSPGDTSGSTTNADVATFFATSAITSVAINSTAGNSTPLNLAGITFTGASKSAYTIGSTSGNALWLSSGATNQIVISGGGSTVAGNTETVNAPIVLQPATNITAGTYQFQNNSALAGDVLVIAGSVTGGTTTQGIALTLRGASTNATNAVSGAISNGGATLGISISKLDAGTWTLSGANSYSGATTVGGGILNVNGSNSGVGSYSVSAGTLTFNPSGTVATSSIAFGGANTTVNVNGGTVTVSGSVTTSQSASRSMNLNGGVLQVATNLYTAAAASDLKFNGGTLKSGSAGGLTLDASNFVSIHTATVLAGGATLDTTIGNITSTAVFNGTGSGSITVKGGNTFKSNVTNNGLFTLQDNSKWDIGSTGGASAVFLNSSVAGLSGNGSVINSSATDGTLTSNFANSVGPFTYSGNIAPVTTSRIALIKNGTGTQILTGANTYTGATTVSGGILQIGDGGTTGSLASGSAISLASGTSLVFNRSNSVTQGTDFSSTDISGAGSVTQNGASTLTFNTANSYSGGTTINTGAISATSSGALGSGAVTTSAASRLLVSNNSTLGNAINIAGQANAPVTSFGRIESVSGNNAINGAITFNSFGGSYVGITSTAGTLTLGGNLTAAVVTGNRFFSFAGAGDTISNGNITDGTAVVGVQKDGAGALTFGSSSTNSYTGTTTVTGGKLVVNGNVSTSAVTVSTGATIGGSGSLGGNLTVAAGGTLAPGNSPGNLTLGNGLTLAGSYSWELAALSTASPGTDFDTVTVTAGSVDITGAALQLSLGAFAPTAVSFWQTDQTWSGIINNTGAGLLNGTFAAIDNTAWLSLGAFSTANTGNDVNLVWTAAVPEPASAASAGLAGILMMLYRRRSTRN